MFIILTLVGPLAYLLLIGASVYIGATSRATRSIYIVDNQDRLPIEVEGSESMQISFIKGSTSALIDTLVAYDNTAIVVEVPPNFDYNAPTPLQTYSSKAVSLTTSEALESKLEEGIRKRKLQDMNLPPNLVDSLSPQVSFTTTVIDEGGNKKDVSGAALSGISFVSAFAIYIFIFLYGGLVLRGVQEEKQNRVVEVLVSTVRPFTMMLGKITGIAAVGLTQFVLWIILTLILINIVALGMADFISPGLGTGATPGGDASPDMLANLSEYPIGSIALFFLFYFLGGYLLYSSLFAAVAAAADSQSDTYQFMFPISMPIIFTIAMIPGVVESPDGPLAFWLSIIPFTSPVAMMARIPFGVPTWQIILSMILLVGGFLGAVYLASKIYRTGILMYGKKINLKELVKWLRYS